MSEQAGGEAAARQGVPVVEQLEQVVEGVVGAASDVVADPPEQMPDEFTLRRKRDGETLAEIFGAVREQEDPVSDPTDPEDRLTKFEEEFRRGLVEEETAARAEIDALREEARELANGNQDAFKLMNARRETLSRLAGLNEKAAAELEAKKAHLARAHEALIKLGKKGGTAEEIEAVMADIDPEAAEKLVAARHERRPRPVLTVVEMAEPTRSLKPVPEQPADVAPAEPVVTEAPVATEEVETDEQWPEEVTRPFDTKTEFRHPDQIKYDPTTATADYLEWLATQNHVQTDQKPSGQEATASPEPVRHDRPQQ